MQLASLTRDPERNIKWCVVFNCALAGNIAQTETLVLNVSGRILMVNKETNGNATEHLVSQFIIHRHTLLRDAS